MVKNPSLKSGLSNHSAPPTARAMAKTAAHHLVGFIDTLIRAPRFRKLRRHARHRNTGMLRVVNPASNTISVLALGTTGTRTVYFLPFSNGTPPPVAER